MLFVDDEQKVLGGPDGAPGQADHDMALSSVRLAHQYLAKPCDAQTMRTTVDRAVNLHVKRVAD